MIAVRAVRADDAAAIWRVEQAAFGRDGEADLVDRLRADGEVQVELVAEADGEVVGHILFSRLAIGPITGAALAPVAVAPARQSLGIGSALISDGLQRCRELGVPAVVVLGHPNYYPRFGFDRRLASRLESPFAGPSFMALELTPGALAGGGAVRYAPAFDR